MTTNEFTIHLSNLSTYHSITMTNNIGQELLSQSLNTIQVNVPVSTLPAGLYYIIFRGEHGREVRKFVKM